MTPVLVILALLSGFAGILLASQATIGVALIAFGCLLGIIARIRQADEQDLGRLSQGHGAAILAPTRPTSHDVPSVQPTSIAAPAAKPSFREPLRDLAWPVAGVIGIIGAILLIVRMVFGGGATGGSNVTLTGDPVATVQRESDGLVVSHVAGRPLTTCAATIEGGYVSAAFDLTPNDPAVALYRLFRTATGAVVDNAGAQQRATASLRVDCKNDRGDSLPVILR